MSNRATTILLVVFTTTYIPLVALSQQKRNFSVYPSRRLGISSPCEATVRARHKGKRKMKKSGNNKSRSFWNFFLQLFGIVFLGFSLCNIFAVTTDCLFNGFGLFFTRICELPYLLYLFFSLIISAVLAFVICRKTK